MLHSQWLTSVNCYVQNKLISSTTVLITQAANRVETRLDQSTYLSQMSHFFSRSNELKPNHPVDIFKSGQH